MSEKPRIANAPGLTWRFKIKEDGWEALWRARTDIVAAGYEVKNVSLWVGRDPSKLEAARIADECQRLQGEMLKWRKGGPERIVTSFDGSLRSLIDCYQTDVLSTWHKKRWHVRKDHAYSLRRIVDRHGHQQLEDIKARSLLEWHAEWTDGGVKLALGSIMIGLLRTAFSFGATILEDPQCERLCVVLHHMRFPAPKPRTERLTIDQVIAVRKKARQVGLPSIALAQAFQFDLMLRQKDCIGEWVPTGEPGVSDVVSKKLGKWLRGIRWSEIDSNFILKHTTSKRGKELEVDLKLAPMVMEEFALYARIPLPELRREDLPASGPLVVSDFTLMPWVNIVFARHWRKIATICGIPKTVRNMDTRSGAITEATDAGADLEHVRHAATHSDISMTQRYSRGAREKTDNVLSIRAASRNKPRTGEA